jgi:hypothetical protein
MGDPIFARTRHEYGSYVDFWRLVELSGFQQCFIDEMQPDSDSTYIIPVRNGELPATGFFAAQARIIHWNLEWCVYPPLHGISEVWNSDRWYANTLGAKYVPMGSHPGLKDAEPGAEEITYDVAYLGYMIPRRARLLHELDLLGVRSTPTSAWGRQRHELLTVSRAYLHVHQLDDKPGVPPLRMVVAAAYSLPVISEAMADRGIFGYSHFMTSRIDKLAEFAALWTCRGGIAEQQRLADYGRALHDLLCDRMTFRKSVEAAL